MSSFEFSREATSRTFVLTVSTNKSLRIVQPQIPVWKLRLERLRHSIIRRC